jgi:hypothetical protein
MEINPAPTGVPPTLRMLNAEEHEPGIHANGVAVVHPEEFWNGEDADEGSDVGAGIGGGPDNNDSVGAVDDASAAPMHENDPPQLRRAA